METTRSPGILEVLRKRAEELNLSELVLYDIDEENLVTTWPIYENVLSRTRFKSDS